MKTRFSSILALTLSLALLSSVSGVSAQPPAPSLPAYQEEAARGVAAEQYAHDVQVVGQLGGTTLAVTVEGNLAYAGVGPRLVILDISDPTQPVRTGQSAPLPEIVERIKVVGSLAYVADGYAGLYIFDVSNPARPSLLGHHDTPGQVYDLVIEGDYAYVADGGEGLKIVDISNPAVPGEVGAIDTPSAAHGVALAWPYAYVASYYNGIRIIDVTDPAHPLELSPYDEHLGYPVKIAVDGVHAYVVDRYRLTILDITDPESPTEAGVRRVDDSTDVVVVGDTAYVAYGYYDGGLRVIDVRDRSNPVEVGFRDTGDYAAAVAVAGAHAYVASSENGLRVVDVSSPLAPDEVGHYDTPGTANDVALSRDYA
ncbi:MAG: hypothetical protein M8467_20860, partial [Anaerolineae bacterium]|nr:hypothetical protein [Anaerolineae bacterium]